MLAFAAGANSGPPRNDNARVGYLLAETATGSAKAARAILRVRFDTATVDGEMRSESEISFAPSTGGSFFNTPR
jgi:hypothetical protein